MQRIYEYIFKMTPEDWRKVKMERHPAHLHLVWFHWSKRPRLYICYWDEQMNEQRHKALGFNKHGIK